MLIHRLILKSRARRWRKAAGAEVPTVCVGNVTAGGTGKTPFTELTLRLLQDSPRWGMSNLAMLSRGYKRRSRGFQQIMRDSSAAFAGDEPLQIKKKFPAVTVAVDKNRVEGCDFLTHPEKLSVGSFKAGKAMGMKRASVRSARGCKDKDFPAADIIVLDDALQFRRLHATFNIVLVDYNRPVFQDKLLPFGRLRDLPSRSSGSRISSRPNAPVPVLTERASPCCSRILITFRWSPFSRRPTRATATPRAWCCSPE